MAQIQALHPADFPAIRILQVILDCTCNGILLRGRIAVGSERL